MRINIKVKPNSGRQELIKLSSDAYLANIKSPPEKNKANIELIKLIKKEFGKQAKIIKGLSSKNKVVEI